MGIWPLDPEGAGAESEAGDFAQSSLTEIPFTCMSWHQFPQVLLLFQNEGQPAVMYI